MRNCDIRKMRNVTLLRFGMKCCLTLCLKYFKVNLVYTLDRMIKLILRVDIEIDVRVEKF